jgi:site-specific recombinase XerD
MRRLNFELKQLCRRNRDGSRSTQVARERILSRIANSLHELGFRNMQAKSLKSRHVESYVKHMFEKGMSPGTMKNDMAAIRWWAEKMGKPGVVAKSNDHYGIPKREYVTNESKAIELTRNHLEKITEPYIRISLELQAMFGLRREEAMKIKPRTADKGRYLLLKASWCKGGRSRAIPVRNSAQRKLLGRAKELAGSGSLIPANRSYREHLSVWEKETARAGVSKTHGLRHNYAQTRYFEITGWNCPAAGGTKAGELSEDRKLADRVAREIISLELGHNREEITAVYLGR